MGHHFVPKYYLKGFTDSTAKYLWAFENKCTKKFRVSIENIGHENDYYNEDIEQYLANEVENPANNVISKIRNRENITRHEKHVLSVYMLAFLKRGPTGKQRVRDLAPSVAEELVPSLNSRFDRLAQQHPDKLDRLEKRRELVISRMLEMAQDPPKDVWLQTLSSEYSDDVAKVISNMTWCFLVYDDCPTFLASDNPVFYSTDIGVGDPRSELSFPISSNVLLWASWSRIPLEGYHPISLRWVKEFNRRTVQSAFRHIYHARDDAWVQKLTMKKRHRLNRIQI